MTKATRRDLEDGIKLDFGREGGQSYAALLRLEQLLGAQKPFQDTPSHDSLLFIVIHHVAELWLKLILHEIEGASSDIASDGLGVAFKKPSLYDEALHLLARRDFALSHEDVWQAARHLTEVTETGEYRDPRFQAAGSVT